jgi:hypothetical protein
MPDLPMVFADGILDANVAHGVARITLAQTGPDGQPVGCAQLMVPLVQMPALTNGLLALLKQIDARVKQAQGAAPLSVAATTGAASVPTSFRYAG